MTIHYDRPNLRPGIRTQNALEMLLRGIETFTTPLALTLGPTRGAVLNDRGGGEPEFLTDSATIARRVIELPGRSENVGAMMLRTMVWEMHETYGDGAATASVIARAMLREGSRLIAAGFNPAILRTGIERGLALALQALNDQAEEADDQEIFTCLASSVSGDPALGAILGEMYDLLGEHAAVITEEGATPHLDREYVKGGLWDAVPASRLLLPEGAAALELAQPLVAIIDDDIKSASDLQPLLEQAVALPGKLPLLILARSFSEEALALLITNHVRGVLTVGAVTLASASLHLPDVLADIAILTGGQVFSPILGRPLYQASAEHFGHARRVRITRRNLAVIDGSGSTQAIQQRIQEIRSQMARLKRGEEEDRQHLRVRIACLAGGMGILKIGAYTEHEREQLKERAQKAIAVLEMAVTAGVVPGGGIAYLDCIPALEEARQNCTNLEEAAGIGIVMKALEAPFLQIVHNHGQLHPPVALMRVREHAGQGYGFNALTGTFSTVKDAGILDCLTIARASLEAGASLAAMTLTTDTIVYCGDRK